MPSKVTGSHLRGPFISLFIAITAILVAVTVVFIYGYKNKLQKEELERQMRYRDRLSLYTEQARESIERAYRILGGGQADGYRDGLSEPKAAMDTCKDMIDNFKDYPEPYLLRSRIFTIMRDLDAAEADLNKYIEKKPPTFPLAYVDRAMLNGLRFLYLSLADASPTELRKIGEAADDDVERFITWFTEDLKKSLDNTDVLKFWNSATLMGMRQLYSLNYGKAATWFENYVDQAPDPITLRGIRILATLRLWMHLQQRLKDRMGMPDDLDTEQERQVAKETLEEIPHLLEDALKKTCPTHPEFLCLAGHFYLATNQPDKAMEMFQAVLKIDLGFNLANYGIARAHLAKGEPDKAIDAIKAFTIAESTRSRPLITAGVHLVLARAHAAKGSAEESLKDYAAALALDPSSIDLHLERAAALVRASKFSAAELDLSFVLNTHPDHIEARLARIDVYIASGERAKALADLDKSEKINEQKKFGREAAIKEKKQKAESLPPR